MYADATSGKSADTEDKAVTNVLGYPGIGDKRELKWAIESFWQGQSTEEELLSVAGDIKRKNWKMLKDSGIDLIPSNDFTLYDRVLDMSCMVGAIPERFGGKTVDIELYFRMIGRSIAGEADVKPCEMTKWFNTNYHYIVPELDENINFRLSPAKIFDEFTEALDIGILTKPVLIGPVTYLMLSKSYSEGSFDVMQLIDKLIPVYEEIIEQLGKLGAKWIQIDEPVFSFDLSEKILNKLKYTYDILGNSSKVRLMVANYFGDLGSNLSTFVNLPVDAVHIDAVACPNEVFKVADAIKGTMRLLSVGIIDGKNIWSNDLGTSIKMLSDIADVIGKTNMMVGTSSSLEHVPVSIKYEENMDGAIKNQLSFAKEKIVELSVLSEAINGNLGNKVLQDKIIGSKIDFQVDRKVRERCEKITQDMLSRKSGYPIRAAKHRGMFYFPLLPVTTIGSFPQTKEIRKARSDFKKGRIDKDAYENFIKDEIARVIGIQQEIGIDLFVHGEPERNDMVEYFADKLNGLLVTQNGWVRSYGTRCVKPPIIYADVSRKSPMTVKWTKYAQSLSKKPIKGMLTGPNTILQWSFVRDDQHLSQTAAQIALAIRDEVFDLEEAGIKIIQVDEPALREGLPLRKSRWNEYLKWAIDSFRLAVNGVADTTQIHTHMCYSEFNDIIKSIAEMDADVISIEASRSNMELLKVFGNFEYPNQIGPGIYDIHSPRIPTVEEIAGLITGALAVIPKERLWINPDCGLKTRRWCEVIPSLKNMVAAAELCRDKL